MTDNHTAFFYGTLMSPEVLYRVIYGTTTPDPWQKERLSIQPGLLYGFQRHRVKEVDYPAIYPLENSDKTPDAESRRVLGVIVKGLSDMDIMRLDVFEGDEYDRKQVEAYPLEHSPDSIDHVPVPESSIQADTYVWKTQYVSQLDPAEWDFEEFRREKLQYWAGPDVMRYDYALVDAAVAEQKDRDSTGGRGSHGSISKQLADLQQGNDQEEPLRSAA